MLNTIFNDMICQYQNQMFALWDQFTALLIKIDCHNCTLDPKLILDIKSLRQMR